MYKFREQYNHHLHCEESEENKLKLKIIKSRALLPEHIGGFCEGLFFKHSIVSLNWDTLEEKFNKLTFLKIRESMSKETGWICGTCYRYISKGKVP